MTDEPEQPDVFVQMAAAKAQRKAAMLTALGVPVEPERGDAAGREPPPPDDGGA